MNLDHVYALVLAGGQSSRLFPFNKVLSDLTGSGRSLIQQACDRLSWVSREQIYILTVKDMVVPIRRQLPLPAKRFFVDPVRRGTWPALLWAMAHVQKGNPAATLAVLTADHVIPNGHAFRKAVTSAVAVARAEPAVVTLGVRPNRVPQAWRGFGAVKAGTLKRHLAASGIKPVVDFEEKPSLARAAEMIREGDWSWNAGMFFFRISTAEAALRHYQPAMWEVYEALAEALAKGRLSRAARLYKAFPARIPHPLNPARLVDNTIDYAILTPMVRWAFDGAQPFVLPNALPGWMDVGEWTALRQVIRPDRRGNILLGKVRAGPGTTDCILAADRGHRIEASGVRGMVAAFSNGRALVLPAAGVGRVKDLVQAAGPEQAIVSAGTQHLRLSIQNTTLILSNR